ncbi:NUDIX domain-containing protein [Halosimplex salinum]|uniref:NUDIX domain-containing protein n=1 Tax=Halosimplex salinum TaxID=1710538 RepID=UPI000F477066|nr:NUDIX domain-containing protein [Halosimplex salinum]
MPNTPPDYCPSCGGRLEPVDPPAVQRCADCGEYEFFNPIPTARIAVLDSGGRSLPGSAATPHDGDGVLLVKVDVPDRDLWGTPGGMVEAGEDPDVAGARELEEETTLTVDPADLVLFDARTFVKFEATHKTCLCYAVDAADVSGTPEADDEVADARFWTPDELAAAEDRLLTSWPEAYKDLQWWVDEGRAALERDR